MDIEDEDVLRNRRGHLLQRSKQWVEVLWERERSNQTSDLVKIVPKMGWCVGQASTSCLARITLSWSVTCCCSNRVCTFRYLLMIKESLHNPLVVSSSLESATPTCSQFTLKYWSMCPVLMELYRSYTVGVTSSHCPKGMYSWSWRSCSHRATAMSR